MEKDYYTAEEFAQAFGCSRDRVYEWLRGNIIKYYRPTDHAIYRIPKTELARGMGVELNEKGEIITKVDSSTSVKGVFAAGDATNRDFKQGITGAAEGVIAAFSTYRLLRGEKN